MQKTLPGILFFIIVVLALSLGVRFLVVLPILEADMPFLIIFALAAFLTAVGPTLSAFLAWGLFGKKKKVSSLTGTWASGGVMMICVPVIILTIVGHPNENGVNPHIAGGLMGAIIMLYALGEEIGWRGYLNDALGGTVLPVRALLIAVVWWVWHFWFITDDMTLTVGIRSFGMLAATAFIFSFIISETKSWLSVAAFHGVGNIAFLSGAFSLPSDQRLMIGGVCFVLMLIIQQLWKNRNAQRSTEAAD